MTTSSWTTAVAAVWHTLLWSRVPLHHWGQGSMLYRWVGWLGAWRGASWLMPWADWIAAGLIALVLGLSPFVSNNLTGLLLIAGFGFWLLMTVTDDRPLHQAHFTPIHLLVLGYWGIATIATAFSPVRSAAMSGWIKLSLFLGLFMLMAQVLRNERLRSGLITVYLHVSLLISVYGMRQWFFGAEPLPGWVDVDSPLANMTRVYSFLGNPNLLAGYLIPAVALSAAAFLAWRGWLPKALGLVMFLVNTTCLVLTFSRGGWIGLVLGLFTFLMLLVYWYSVYLPGIWRTLAFPLVFGAAIVGVALAVFSIEPLYLRVSSMFMGRADTSNNFRLNVWMSGLEMLRDYPVWGIGPGNDAFVTVYRFYQKARFTALGAYSVLLEIAIETGLIGLTWFLWLLLVIGGQAQQWLQQFRIQRHADGFWVIGALAAMVGLMGHGLVDTVWFRPQVNVVWWLLVALVASYGMPHRVPQSPAAV